MNERDKPKHEDWTILIKGYTKIRVIPTEGDSFEFTVDDLRKLKQFLSQLNIK